MTHRSRGLVLTCGLASCWFVGVGEAGTLVPAGELRTIETRCRKFETTAASRGFEAEPAESYREFVTSPNGRFLLVPGRIREADNKSGPGYPVVSQGSRNEAMDHVLGVLDQESCQVLGLFNVPPDPRTYRAAFSRDSGRVWVRVVPCSFDDEVKKLATADPERAARVAARKPEAPRFVLAGGAGFSRQLASLGIDAPGVYESSDGFIVLGYAKGKGMERGAPPEESGWLVLRAESGTTAFTVLDRDTPSAAMLSDIVVTNGPEGPVGETRTPDNGEIARVLEPIYVDDGTLVLRYRSDVRSKGRTVKQRQFLAAWRVAAGRIAVSELPYAAEDVNVKTAGGRLLVSYSMTPQPGAAPDIVTRDLDLPK